MMLKKGICITALILFATAASAEDKGVIAPGAEPVKLAGGYKFTEGPVEDIHGNVYFTEDYNTRIHRWSPDGTITVIMEDAGNPAGLALDRDGSLLICQKSKRRMISLAKDGTITVLADTFNGQPFNQPNDLWVDAKGGIYFSDPHYGPIENMLQGGKHVYYLKPDRKEIIRVTTTVAHPNGVIGSRDGKTLYVADNRGEVKCWAFDINNDGTLSNKRLHADQGADGVTLDSEGNIYLSMDEIFVYNPKGELIDTITLPERPTNMCFIGEDKQTLFITSATSIYTLRMRVKGYQIYGEK